MNKAELLLNSNKSVAERASKYAKTVSKAIKTDMLDAIKRKIDNIDSKIFDLENFSLETDMNRGITALTKESVQERFEHMINLEHNKTLLELEYKSKKAAFDSYFKTDVKSEKK